MMMVFFAQVPKHNNTKPKRLPGKSKPKPDCIQHPKPSTMPVKANRFLFGVFAAAGVIVIVSTCCKSAQTFVDPTQPPAVSPLPTKEATERSLLTWSQDEEEVMLQQIREKLKPAPLLVDEDKVLEPKQFLHLHNMKTGGTSIDNLLRCARDRLHDEMGFQFNHYSIHECSRGQFRRCVENSTDPCRDKIEHAGTMSLCSALKYLPTFQWNDEDRVRAFTVLRHPVDRVWSMFRFEARMCYECKNLTEIYDRIDNNDIYGLDSLCLAQLQNHETANLLSSDWPEDASDDEIVAEAIGNLKTFFTVIGLTEELTLSAQILGTVFPWLNKTIEGSHVRCSLSHANGSPENNHCIKEERTDGGKGYLTSHWELPSHPDDKTREAIEAHNQLDIKLYEAAVQYFELQKRAFEENESESRRALQLWE